MATGTEIALHALSQRGDPYIWGAWPDPSDPDPDGEDCSGLTRWSHGRAGVYLPGGSWLQAKWLWEQGCQVPIEGAIRDAGKLLFSFSDTRWKRGIRPHRAHVAVSLGNRQRQTAEAKSKRDGVGVFSADGRGWTFAARHPKVDYTPQGVIVHQQPAQTRPPEHPEPDMNQETFVVMHNGQGNPAANGAAVIVRGGIRFPLDTEEKLRTALNLEKVTDVRIVNQAGWRYYEENTLDGAAVNVAAHR